jgi:hypothetical protein
VAVSNRPRSLGRLLTRRVWLPRWLYAAVPWLYLLLGSASLASAVLLPDPDWILPFAGLADLALLHAGLWVATVRYQQRRRRPAPEPARSRP